MANTLKFGNGEWYGKEDTILAYNDERNNIKPLPFSFERGSVATRINKEGLIETVGANEPRVDFLNDSKGALLLEPTRTNYIPYSTLDFNGGSSPIGWSIGFGTGTYSYEQLEYKGQKAVKQTQITTGRSYLDTGLISILANTEHTLKIQFILDECVADANDIIVNFLDFGIDEYYSFSDIDANGVLELQYNPLSDNVGNLRIGLGCSGNEDGGKSLAWAIPQLEQGSYATSYIPTQGGAVTRLADSCNNGGNEQVINSTEGTLYVEANLIDGYDNNNWLGIIYDNSNANNRVYIQRYLGNIQGGIRVNGVIQSEITQSNSSLGKNKIAFTFKQNEFKLFVNGSQVSSTDTSGSVFSANTLNTLNVGVYHDNTLQFNSGIDDVKLYNIALTDQELQALTTI